MCAVVYTDCTAWVSPPAATPNPFVGHVEFEDQGGTGQLFADGVLAKHHKNCVAP